MLNSTYKVLEISLVCIFGIFHTCLNATGNFLAAEVLWHFWLLRKLNHKRTASLFKFFMILQEYLGSIWACYTDLQ